ncbi:ankyrin repeat domain-containing protein [uncultured Brachyspira sp.]|uniref:ankyrin repeat domain-containing protein n=1 Tax=uncultured Brachyspira sp. TaxID=221953 RepID=UPI0026283E91|nr:ankyrin repeat domain-containing protein [uncultured Brachyspira sp.]
MRHIKFLFVLLTFSYSVFALTPDEANLFNAVNEKNADNVLNILSNSININVNILDDEGYTPLHRAIYNRDLNTVNTLLKYKNIDVNSKLDMKVSIDGWYLGGATPLILASYIGESDIAAVLLDNNADIKSKDDVDGSMAIHMASANGNNETIKILLDKEPSIINDVDNRGNTPLHWAAMKDKPETVKLLIENGADMESKDADGWTPLHYAAAFSSLQTVKMLIDLGADKESKTKDGNYPVYYARRDDVKNYFAENNIERENNIKDETVIADNNTKETEIIDKDMQGEIAEENVNNAELDIKQLEMLIAVKNNDIIALNALIKEGINPNFTDENGYTPLHLAVINNSLDLVESLLTYKNINKEAKLPYKADLNNWYLGGATPLITASYIGNPDIVYTLINAGCNIRARDDIDGAMPIHVAAANGNDDVIVLLLEKDKTLINETDNNGDDTALHWACMKNKPSTVSLLLKYNADSKIQNTNGDTALHYAAMYASADIIKSIVNADKSSVNIPNNEKIYPIHYAAMENNSDALVSLVQDGNSDVNIKDSNNDTPLHYAAAYGNIDSVMSLVEKCNADKTLKDSEGYTAADLASDNGYENIVIYLKGDSKYIPENNDKNNTKSRDLILPEYIRKPDLSKKWW